MCLFSTRQKKKSDSKKVDQILSFLILLLNVGKACTTRYRLKIDIIISKSVELCSQYSSLAKAQIFHSSFSFKINSIFNFSGMCAKCVISVPQ